MVKLRNYNLSQLDLLEPALVMIMMAGPVYSA